jgi:hypothetical protein
LIVFQPHLTPVQDHADGESAHLRTKSPDSLGRSAFRLVLAQCLQVQTIGPNALLQVIAAVPAVPTSSGIVGPRLVSDAEEDPRHLFGVVERGEVSALRQQGGPDVREQVFDAFAIG